MNDPHREHPDQESLERFLLNMLSEGELEILETHILACGQCVGRLENLETEIAATRLALKQLEAAEQILKSSSAGYSRWRTWLAFPRWSFVAGGALAAATLVIFSIPRDVTLTAFRGAETVIVSEGWPLRMHLNATGLASGPVIVELADNDGAIVWKGASVVWNGKVDVRLPRITKSGAHFLRLYAPARVGYDVDLLREFALNAQWTI